jgi:hypothetical protein
VFTAVPSGFTGTLAPAACLTPSAAPLAADTNAIVASTGGSALDVFIKPAGGWSGTIAPAAQLQPPDGA